MTSRFIELKSNQPQAGDTLTTVTGKDIPVFVRDEANGKRTVLCRASVNLKHDGWFLSDEDIGIVCLILPEAQKKLRENHNGDLVANKLKVVRYHKNGRSLLCEVEA